MKNPLRLIAALIKGKNFQAQWENKFSLEIERMLLNKPAKIGDKIFKYLLLFCLEKTA